MSLELTIDEARFLKGQMESRVAHLENELVHTDKFSLQHEIGVDVAKLRTLCDRMTQLDPE
jgi:hypothetical protein